eukprot:gnl/MRDRNA2_/MRDRNA2_81462_c0_seq1.p1 gnl/MRDRNA2_/MRDRNA2_81462_c0~~gnl/MRDRNA2_/MRDRNA2_81462_c0_seq1.p1  ORF type:complete len:423 (-),score=59.27 gnl/MRDRNA2_/MRDRNA2_81462_c0_seq1:154-1422(-)
MPLFKCFKGMKGLAQAPAQETMSMTCCEVVPGQYKDKAVIIGVTEQWSTVDNFIEQNLPEQARYCKGGQHFQWGGNFYVNNYSKQELSAPPTCCQHLSHCCSAILPCSGQYVFTGIFRSGYQSLDSKGGNLDQLEYEDTRVQTKSWKCCQTTFSDKYHIAMKKNGITVGGIKFREEGYRICCGIYLRGLEGQPFGMDQPFAWLFQGEGIEGEEEKISKGAFGTYLRNQPPPERCCAKCMKCGSCTDACGACKAGCLRKLAGCCVCCPGLKTMGTAVGEFHCAHKKESWVAKVPDAEGKGLGGAFWQVKEIPALAATEFKRPVCIMSKDETQAAIAMGIMPHPHTEGFTFLMNMGSKRDEVLPPTRDRYGLGWSTGYQHLWSIDSQDAVNLVENQEDMKFVPKSCKCKEEKTVQLSEVQVSLP